jgi:dCTP deaminase
MAEMAGSDWYEGDGVFPIQWLRRAAEQKWIHSDAPLPGASFQPASLDLRLGERAHRLRCSFLPTGRPIEERLAELSMGEIDLRDGDILERDRPYLVPLLEELKLPPGVRAKANPKSSTGRLDVLTRVITEHGRGFDEIPGGYHGPLWLEVVPLSFTVRVKTGLSLTQLRLVVGDAGCSEREIRELHAREPLLLRKGKPVPDPEFRTTRDGGFFLGVDLGKPFDVVTAFKAKKNSALLDMSREDYPPEEFWEELHLDEGRLILEPSEFYLLLSLEEVRIPPGFAGDMTAYDPTSGELRTHYAGFFDPGFGHGELSAGSRAALEVRAHDVAFLIETGQPVCKLVVERMAEAPEETYGGRIGSSYQDQVTTLSKHFLERAVPGFRRGHQLTLSKAIEERKPSSREP